MLLIEEPTMTVDTAPAEEFPGWLLSPLELELTREKFDKINERAARKGFTGRLKLAVEREDRTYTNALGLPVTEERYRVKLTGEAPSYGGWKLLAVLDFDPEAGLITRTAPGVERVDRSEIREGYCAHCRTVRMRTKSYLVGNEAGETKQVGSSCIKDFLGHSASPVFIYEADVREELESGMGGFGGTPSYATETVLAAAWTAIKVDGYVRANAYEGRPTKQVAQDIIEPPRNERDRRKIAERYGTDLTDSIAKAREVREFLLSDDFAGDSEFVINLKAIAAADMVTPRNFGLLCFAPEALARHQEKTLMRKRENEGLRNEVYPAAPKTRMVFEVRVTGVRYIQGDYGTTTLYTLVTTDGYRLKWFASNDILGEEASDEVIKIKATIKGQDEYNGQISTTISRAALA